MAAGEPKFSHITVTSDEDEVVIQAGARPARPVASTAPRDAELPAEPSAPVAADAAPIDGEGGAEADPAEPETEQDEFRETTLEDLKGAPMTATQKVVLAFAAVGVLAVVAYVFFMR